MSEVLICDMCGGEARLTGEDAIDYCDECGVVEGYTHIEQDCNE